MADNLDVPLSVQLMFGDRRSPSAAPGPAGSPAAARDRLTDDLSAQRQAQLAADTEVKKRLLSGDETDLRVLATSMEEGNALTDTRLAELIQLGQAGTIAREYGPEVLDRLPELWNQGNREAVIDNQERTGGEVAGDAALGIGAGLVSGAGGLLALGGGLINEDLGATIAGATNFVTNGIRGAQSDRLAASREQAQIRSALDADDIDRQYQEDVAEGRSFPGMARFGREVLAQGTDLLQNPELAGDFVAEGGGSFILGGALAKGLGLGAKGMQGVIGALEAGGAYTGVQAEIQSLTEEDLKEGSSAYRGMRADGLSHDDAKNKLANRAGLTGATLAGVLGFVSGGLVSKFEVNPFASSAANGARQTLSGSLKTLGRQTLLEGAEEAIQGAGGRASQNIGMLLADEDRSITAGMGQDFVTGAVAGMGIVPAMRGPSVALGAIGSAADGLGTIGRGLASAARSRASSVDASVDNASPTGDSALDSAVTSMSEALNQASPAAVAEAPVAAGEAAPVLQAPEPITAELGRLSRVEAAELRTLPAGVLKATSLAGVDFADDNMISRAEAIGDVVKAVSTNQLQGAELLDAALWIRTQTEAFKGLTSRPDADQLGSDVQGIISTLRDGMDTVLSNKTVKGLIEQSGSVTAADFGKLPEISPTTIDTPEVAQAMSRMDLIAQANPTGVDAGFIRAVLNQKRPGGVSEDAAKRLKAAAAIAEQAKAQEELRDQIAADTDVLEAGQGGASSGSAAKRKTRSVVAQEIRVDGKSEKHGQVSIARYVADVNGAMARGDKAQANQRMADLYRFARHMQNKLEAANSSAAMARGTDNKVKYRTLSVSGWLNEKSEDANEIYVNPWKADSVQTWREVHADAQAVRDAFNAMVEAYGGDLEGQVLNALKTPDFTRLIKRKQDADARKEAQAQIDAAKPKTATEAARESDNGNDSTGQEGQGKEQGQDSTRSDQADQEQASAPEVTVSGDEGRVESDQSGAGDSAGATGTGDRVDTGVVEETKEASVTTESSVEKPIEFVGLANENGLNRFNRAFRIMASKSKAMASKNPVRGVQLLLQNPEKLAKVSLGYQMTPDRAQKWDRFIGRFAPQMIDWVNALLTVKASTLGDQDSGTRGNRESLTPLEAIDAQNQQGTKNLFLSQASSLVLNLVNTETNTFEPKLLQAGVLAALHWLATLSNETPRRKDEALAKIFGVQPDEVTPEMREKGAWGMTERLAKESLGSEIVKFWGAETSRDVPMSDIRGISEGLAIALLGSMKDLGLIEEHFSEKEKADGSRIVELGVIRGKPEMVDWIRSEMGAARSFLEDALIPEADREVRPTFDAPATGQKRAKKGKKYSGVSEAQQREIDAHRQVRFMRNLPFLDMTRAFGRDAYLELRGWQKPDAETMNRNTLSSVEGLNRSLEMEWDNLAAHDERLVSFAKDVGKDPDTVATHFEAELASNERVMYQGFNPQASKFMREGFVATVSTLDMTAKKDQRRFWLTVAQSLGVKTEERSGAANEKLARAKVKALKPAIEILKSRLKSQANPKASAGSWFSAEDIAAFKKALNLKAGEVMTDKMFHALLSVARLEVAQASRKDRSGVKAFRHDLALEADGKTDGPINAIMLWLGGVFSGNQILDMRRGGFFPAEQGMTLNAGGKRAVRTELKGDPLSRSLMSLDLYSKVAGRFSKGLVGFILDLKGTKAQAHGQALMRLMRAFGDVTFDGQTLKISRNGMKNPLTITVYGSSMRGIAGKVTGAMLDNLYAAQTELLVENKRLRDSGEPEISLNQLPRFKDYPGMAEDLALLTSSAVSTGKKDGKTFWMVKDRGAGAQALRNAKTFTLQAPQFEAFRDNVLALYMPAMETAIQESLGGVDKNVRLFQRATSAQSLIFQAMFQKAVKDEIKELRDSGELKVGEFLSNAQFDALSKRLQRYGVVIEDVDGEHSIDLADKEKQVFKGRTFSKGLDGSFSQEVSLKMPGVVGVGAIPQMTISRGDARMMANFYTDPSAIEAGALLTLQVFDGLEMPAHLIESLSGKINEAVAKNWMANPMRDAARSLQDWLSQGSTSPVFDAELLTLMDVAETLAPSRKIGRDMFWKELKSVLDGKVDAKRLSELDKKQAAREALKFTDAELKLLEGFRKDTAKGVYGQFSNMVYAMNEAGDEIEARHAVWARTGYSVDHMASGETPFNQTGTETFDKKRDRDHLSWLNRLYAEELARIQGRKAADIADRDPSPKPEFQARLEAYGAEVAEGVTQISKADLLKAMDSPLMSQEGRGWVRLLKPIMPDFTYMLGTPEALMAWREKELGISPDSYPIELGQTDFDSGIVYLTNLTEETSLHEMLHTALQNAALGYTTDVEDMSTTMKSAFLNLELLADQFVNMNMEGADARSKEAFKTARKAVNAGISSNDPVERAGGILELISWSLTNQDIAARMKASRVNPTVMGRLTKLVSDVLGGLRKILGLKPGQRFDMFSNIAWNTAAVLKLLNTQTDGQFQQSLPEVDAGEAVQVLNQLRPGGLGQATAKRKPRVMDATRLSYLAQRFESKIGAHIRTLDLGVLKNNTGGAALERKARENEIRGLADTAANQVSAAGFLLDPVQVSLFRSIQATFASSMRLDARAMARMQRLFNHVIKDLTWREFMADENSLDIVEQTRAQERFDLITGKGLGTVDRMGRSNLLSTFFALALVDDQFRDTVSKFEMPQDREVSRESVDDFFESIGTSLMNTMETAISGSLLGGKQSITDEIERLADVLSAIDTDARTLLEVKMFEAQQGADGFISDKVKLAAGWLTETADGLVVNNTSKVRERVSDTMKVVAATLTPEGTEVMSEAVISMVNQSKLWSPLKNLAAEIVGLTKSNEDVLELMPQVKSGVSRMREEFREILPEYIASKFSRDLTEEEGSALHSAFGKADVSALMADWSFDEIKAMVSYKVDRDNAREVLLKRMAKIQGMTPQFMADMLAKGRELATFQVTGKIDSANLNLLKNAHAIARLSGEPRSQALKKAFPDGVPEALVQALDAWITLEAIDKLASEQPNAMKLVGELAKTEAEGLSYMAHQLGALRSAEMNKVVGGRALMNHWKGYVPAEAHEGARLIVEEDSEYAKLIFQGYTRVGDYKGSGHETGKRGYYYSVVGASAAWNQGILQTVHRTSMGIDPVTGRDKSGRTAGMIDPEDTAALVQAKRSGKPLRGRGEALIPIWNAEGDTILGYERSMDPAMLAKLEPNTNLTEMLGAWGGRQIEEEHAASYNELLIERLGQQWSKADALTRDKEFVNLADKDLKDPIWREIWALMPREAKQQALVTFGAKDTLMVRRDMVENVGGYRQPSLADIWTDQTRLSPEVTKVIRQTMVGIGGPKTYRFMAQAIKEWQGVIQLAKSAITVLSVVVPVSNIASNIVQLQTRRVGLRDVGTGFATKLVEVNQYRRNEARRIEIQADIAVHKTSPGVVNRLKAELKGLEDANKRMTIWPMIEAGEFTTISSGDSELNSDLLNGTWADKAREYAAKLPEKLGAVGRYAVGTKDTALYQGLSHMVQFGDFMAKSVYYDHLVKNEGLSRQEAIRRVRSEFVPYWFLPGRVRSGLDSVGLTWFWAFKLRIMKVALDIVQRNPATALGQSVLGTFAMDLPIVDVGSPIEDNALTKILQGQAGSTIGLDMLWRAPGATPIGALLG